MSVTTIAMGKKDSLYALPKGQAKTIDWKKYPVYIAKCDLDKMKGVDSVLQNNMRSPSQIAGLTPDEVRSDVIKKLDAECRTAYTRYQNLFDAACREDARRIPEITKKGKKELKRCVKLGLAGILIGGLIGWIVGHYKKKKIIKIEGSSNRRMWVGNIHTFEQERDKRIKTQLKGAGKKLVLDLKDLENRGEIDKQLLKRLQQIEAVYRAVASEELKVADTEVTPFIKRLETKRLKEGV